jgi:hypothetical protein
LNCTFYGKDHSFLEIIWKENVLSYNAKSENFKASKYDQRNLVNESPKWANASNALMQQRNQYRSGVLIDAATHFEHDLLI